MTAPLEKYSKAEETVDVIEALNMNLERQTAHEIISWAVEMYWPHIALSSSFQMQSLPLLHIVSRVAPELPIIFIDTTYHFAETLAFRDRLVEEWSLNLQVVRRHVVQDEPDYSYNEPLYRTDPDLCCYVNKVEPMERVMTGLNAWISGIRRDQTPARANTTVVETTPQGVVRIHPMITWTSRDVWQYINEHNLPDHPLLSAGYLSVGCAPCTRPSLNGEKEREGRWNGTGKTECGLHTMLRVTSITVAEIEVEEHDG